MITTLLKTLLKIKLTIGLLALVSSGSSFGACKEKTFAGSTISGYVTISTAKQDELKRKVQESSADLAGEFYKCLVDYLRPIVQFCSSSLFGGRRYKEIRELPTKDRRKFLEGLSEDEDKGYRECRSIRDSTWEIAQLDLAAETEDHQIMASALGKWLHLSVEKIKADGRLAMPPSDVQTALVKLASQRFPPQRAISAARIMCDHFGLKYQPD
jgi:hypothetical protein